MSSEAEARLDFLMEALSWIATQPGDKLEREELAEQNFAVRLLHDLERERRLAAKREVERVAAVNIVNVTKPDLPDRAAKEIALACKKADEAMAHRDDVLRKWASGGYSLRVLADASGKGDSGKLRITHSGIARVIERGTT